MTTRALLFTVHLLDGRYHGAGAWPPSPARLFQALVAGSGLSGPIDKASQRALRWLEALGAPIVAAPWAHIGRAYSNYVPRNDLDKVGADPRRIGEIRVEKTIRPRLIDASVPLHFAWEFGDDTEEPELPQIEDLAHRLYQLGRGVDMAWATAKVIDGEELDALLRIYPGQVYRPTTKGIQLVLDAPAKGSLDSLILRHASQAARFRVDRATERTVFSQAPKPRFGRVSYEAAPTQGVYRLLSADPTAQFRAWPLASVVKLVTAARDRAVSKLQKAIPLMAAEIERALIGRRPGSADAGPFAARVKIVPLPSIGHVHVDHDVRRLLVEVPQDCPLRADDVHWAFSGLDIADDETGEVFGTLTVAPDDTMGAHYGISPDGAFRRWRTVTPVALPQHAGRRRIDPTRIVEEAKTGTERAAEVARAAAAVVQALRHAEVRAPVATVRVQREPFDAHGARVEDFAPGTRFEKERLWHVEIVFGAAIRGPLVLGDGRYLGLGLMAPVRENIGVHVFSVTNGLQKGASPEALTRAMRRALLARLQNEVGASSPLPPFFTGHAPDGAAASRSTNGGHLSVAFDPTTARLLVIAPHVVERRSPSREESELLDTLARALQGMSELRAGAAGDLRVESIPFDEASDPLFRTAARWRSVTDYEVTRHTKHVGATAAFERDVLEECRRLGILTPSVAPLAVRGVRGKGLIGAARLRFPRPIAGPILLGRGRHRGSGLFTPDDT